MKWIWVVLGAVAAVAVAVVGSAFAASPAGSTWVGYLVAALLGALITSLLVTPVRELVRPVLGRRRVNDGPDSTYFRGSRKASAIDSAMWGFAAVVVSAGLSAGSGYLTAIAAGAFDDRPLAYWTSWVVSVVVSAVVLAVCGYIVTLSLSALVGTIAGDDWAFRAWIALVPAFAGLWLWIWWASYVSVSKGSS